MELRLGFRQIKGLRKEDAKILIETREKTLQNNNLSMFDIWRQTQLGRGALEKLAQADACRSLGLSRRQALWEIQALCSKSLPLFSSNDINRKEAESVIALPEAGIGEEIIEDYSAIKLTLRSHPLALLRSKLEAQGSVLPSCLSGSYTKSDVTVAGLVICIQRPASANGVTFATLEDEVGVANVIIWPKIFKYYRNVIMRTRLMLVTGYLQRDQSVVNVIATRISNLSDWLDNLAGEGGAPLNIVPANATRHRLSAYSRLSGKS